MKKGKNKKGVYWFILMRHHNLNKNRRIMGHLEEIIVSACKCWFSDWLQGVFFKYVLKDKLKLRKVYISYSVLYTPNISNLWPAGH